MTEHVVIIGSGPAGFSAAIYAARANCTRFCSRATPAWATNRWANLLLPPRWKTTPVFPADYCNKFIDSAITEENKWLLPPLEEHPHAVTGPELMDLMRQQAINFGTRVVTDDIVEVDFLQAAVAA